MIFQTLRWTIIISLWRKYQSKIWFTLFMVTIMVVLQLLHGDYLQYQQLKTSPNETYIALSFAVKWALNLGLLGAIIWNWRRRETTESKQKNKTSLKTKVQGKREQKLAKMWTRLRRSERKINFAPKPTS